MLGPYRTIAAAPSSPCAAPSPKEPCPGQGPFPPEPQQFASSCGANTARPPRSLTSWLVGPILAAFSLSIFLIMFKLLTTHPTVKHTHTREVKIIEAPIRSEAAPCGASQWRAPSPRPPLAPRRDGSLLASLGAPTDAPPELWRRAEKLRAAGLDAVLIRAVFSRESIDRTFEGGIVHVEPAPGGLRITGIKPMSAFAMAGLREGDVVLAVNGHALTDPEHALSMYPYMPWKEAVVEILRGERRVFLHVTVRGFAPWREPR